MTLHKKHLTRLCGLPLPMIAVIRALNWFSFANIERNLDINQLLF